MSESSTADAIQLLLEERARLDRVIAVLRGDEPTVEAPRRRGRPPGSKAAAKTATKTAKKRGRRSPMSDAEKKAASERMKKYWAKRRKAEKKG